MVDVELRVKSRLCEIKWNENLKWQSSRSIREAIKTATIAM